MNNPGNRAPHAATEMMEIENQIRYAPRAVGLMEIEHLIRYTPRAVGLMEIENLIRYTEPAVGLKPSARQGKARLRGLSRIRARSNVKSQHGKSVVIKRVVR